MNDARWLRWLELTERALSVPAEERSSALAQLCLERAELIGSLDEQPSRMHALDEDLAQRLRNAERQLAEQLESMRLALADRTQGLRRARTGTRGYRPTLANRPAFVSKSI